MLSVLLLPGGGGEDDIDTEDVAVQGARGGQMGRGLATQETN